MIFEHSFTIKKHPTEAQARSAITAAEKEFEGRSFGLLRSFREGKKVTVVFADGQRPYDAKTLAERLTDAL